MVKIKKVIEVCTRVEGHGSVNIYLDNQNEKITQVNFEIAPFRDFENLLVRKDLFDIPRISSRICGLCHNSQAIVSCKAIEDMYEIEPSERSILLRRLLMTGELIKSHALHFFYQSMPDLLEIFNIRKTSPSLNELIKFDSHLTNNINDLIRFGSEIDNIFGGRTVHAITLFPGGTVYEPSRKKISIAKKYFQKSLTSIEWIIEKFIDLFSKFQPPNEFQVPNQFFLGLHNNGQYDRYSGMLKMIYNKNKKVDFFVKYYTEYFNKEPNLRGIDFKEKNNVLVGPLARYKIVETYPIDSISNYLGYFEKNWSNNILFTNFLRLLEIYTEIYKGIEILDEPALQKKEILPLVKSIKNTEGIAIVEAPRGSLLHHYTLDKNNSISKVKLFIATELNIPLINQMITSYAQKLYEKSDLNLVKKKIQMIIRAFDPCISCATH